MPNQSTKLTEAEVRRYHELGYHCPARALDDDETAEFRRCFDEYFTRNSERLRALLPREQTDVFLQTHTFLRWVYRLAAHPKVLDAVARISTAILI